MDIPTHLEHKPIFVVRDYDQIDGPYAGATDAKGLSVGLATWDNFEIGAKVWRHTGDRWSRQSEDLPPHRAIDLTLLYCLTRLARASGSKSETAKHGAFELTATLYGHGRTSAALNGMLRVLDTHLEEVDSIIRDRLLALADVLDEMKRRGLL